MPIQYNTGFLPVTPFNTSAPLLVSGQGRSGTTGLMRALAHTTGYSTHFPGRDRGNAEDGLTRAFREPTDARIRKIRANRGNHWISKVPNAHLKATRNPQILDAWAGNWLIISRDPLARSIRESLENKGDPLLIYKANTKMIANTGKIIDALVAGGYGVALVSYEKLLVNKGETIAAIWAWMKAAGNLVGAIQEINPSDSRYVIVDRPQGTDSTAGHRPG